MIFRRVKSNTKSTGNHNEMNELYQEHISLMLIIGNIEAMKYID